MRLLTFSFIKNSKLKRFYYGLYRQFSTDGAPATIIREQRPEESLPKADPSLVEICESWTAGEAADLRSAVLADMQVYPEFVTEAEEALLLGELEPYLKKMRYEFDHWDNAIQGYRETERGTWSPSNSVILERVKRLAFSGVTTLPYVHVLDLAAAGHIKPHVDAVRFCGDVIAGICLCSSAVMRLQHEKQPHLALEALLQHRALYVMKGVARYEFSHEVLGGERSLWRGQQVPRKRRVALITRATPKSQD